MHRTVELAPVLSSASLSPASSGGRAFRTGESILRKSSYLALRRLSCEYHDGVLTIRGRVSTFHLKQVAQSLLGKLAGISRIHNLVEVRQSKKITRTQRKF
ncbi:MAG: BON domain-containing protein [Planctomycetes bacterium]|nr:BON domain-containing protein [Planctomycetota bacterium]